MKIFFGPSKKPVITEKDTGIWRRINNMYRIEIDEISLLVYLNRLNKKDLVKTLCNYTGCHENDYTDSEITRLLEKAISDITRKYPIRGLWFNYFDIRRHNMVSAKFDNREYDEISALQSTLFHISPKVFDDEDRKRLEELKKEYMEEK